MQNRQVRRVLVLLVLLGYTGLILWVTIGPAPWAVHGYQLSGGILNPSTWLNPDTWSSGYMWEWGINLLLFLPFGALFAALLPKRRWGFTILISALFGLVIEITQISSVDRVSDPRDLVLNTLGATVGVVLVRLAK